MAKHGRNMLSSKY